MDIDGREIEYTKIRNKIYFLLLVIIMLFLGALVAKESCIDCEVSTLDVYYKVQLSSITIHSVIYIGIAMLISIASYKFKDYDILYSGENNY